ncbi:hypothetical protein WS46_31795 [Burkholderia sp. RF4-BP95]|nr:hypothetical protein WS46_31795 [Burkholderia sp. RF4-BP95]
MYSQRPVYPRHCTSLLEHIWQSTQEFLRAIDCFLRNCFSSFRVPIIDQKIIDPHKFKRIT